MRSRFPGYGLSGEESEDENCGSDFQWLIDPIDGTKYYAGRSSLFSVSVGLLHRGEPVLGVVYAAASRQWCYAWQGGGTYLDGQRLEGPAERQVAEAIANVEMPSAPRCQHPSASGSRASCSS